MKLTWPSLPDTPSAWRGVLSEEETAYEQFALYTVHRVYIRGGDGIIFLQQIERSVVLEAEAERLEYSLYPQP